MALGYLLIFFIALLMITIISILLVFLIKQPKINGIIMFFTALFSIWISYLGNTAMPTNFIGARMIACFWGFLAGVGLLLQYRKKIFAAKLVISASLILGLWDLFFY